MRSVVYRTVSVGAEEWSINKETMSERQNTVVSSFNPIITRTSAFDFHEWIYEQLHVPENAVTMVQIDATPSVHQVRLVTVLSTTGESE